MAKAKKPASTGGEAKDTSKAGPAKPAGSVPKTVRSKPSVSKPAVNAKKATSAVATDPKPLVSEPVTLQDTAPTTETSKPVEDKVSEKEMPKKTETKEEKVGVTPKPAAAVVSEPKESGSIFWPLLIGGALAAVLGFIASEANFLGTRGDTADLRTRLGKQQAQIAELIKDNAKDSKVEFPALDVLTDEVAKLSETVATMEARLTEVEKRPVTGGSSTAAVAAYERELKALQTSVQKQRSEIEGLLNSALSVEEATSEAARNTKLQVALTQITIAINGGKPFAPALAELATYDVNIPAALVDVADSGVVTLTNLQTRFPDTARAALSAGAGDANGGFGAFLRRQLGARSVTPREGSDPDAVLSRTEAAVRDGRLTDALSELDTLPETSQSAMQDWLVDARVRHAAESAAEDLSQRLTAN